MVAWDAPLPRRRPEAGAALAVQRPIDARWRQQHAAILLDRLTHARRAAARSMRKDV
ncbi:hypothetical protein XMIN_3951 [Xanthomonas citri pv. mangiferaeindicae LMG 941]|nr:hypothetical protein XMIN_3951 [Xanthomonas citri pv. mangiferaeindicae LMG 941]